MENVQVCQTCLSADRNMAPIGQFRHVLAELNFWEIIDNIGNICWECSQMITRFHVFKTQVSQAQMLIANPLQLQYNTTLSKLKICHQYVISETENTVNEPNDQENKEPIFIKIEPHPKTIDEGIDNEDYKEEPETIPDTVELDEDERRPIVKKVVVNRKVHLKYKSVKHSLGTQLKNENSGNPMFKTIIYSLEEMKKIREDKMNQPNYKTVAYKCNDCVTGFKKKETLDEHLAKKHDESIGPHECDVCKCRFRSFEARDKHRQSHFELYKCNLCKFETARRALIDTHVSTKHEMDDVDRIHCQCCKEVFSDTKKLEEHMAQNHRIACDECSMFFKNSETLRCHKRRIHKSPRNHICKQCNITFANERRLESHMAKHGPNAARRLSHCDQCNIQFKDIYKLRAHLRLSPKHQGTSHICPICNASVRTKTYLKSHIEYYHNKRSKHSCEQCDMIFMTKWLLLHHRQLKHGAKRVRKHACQHCGKKFFDASTLRSHSFIHSKDRSFMCPLCGDTFKQHAALYNHKKLVHDGMSRKKARTE